MQDYYRDLEVEHTASFEQIKAAYRRKALCHHPDRGGSHAEMVIVNEAWEVLSSPELRRQYDEQRKTGDADQATFEEARQRSRNYERTWRKFDSWLSSISRDFDSAQFGSKKVFGMEMPTASKSVSAWAFLITGGLVGLLVWLTLFVSITTVWAPESDSNPHVRFAHWTDRKARQHPYQPDLYSDRYVQLCCVGGRRCVDRQVDSSKVRDAHRGMAA